MDVVDGAWPARRVAWSREGGREGRSAVCGVREDVVPLLRSKSSVVLVSTLLFCTQFNVAYYSTTQFFSCWVVVGFFLLLATVWD